MAEYKDYYAVLGVPRNADDATIKAAYRKLAAKHHPDRNPDDPAAEDRFKEVGEAYAVLSDPDKRTYYDAYGTAEARSPGPGYGSGFGPGFGPGPAGGASAGGWSNVDPSQMADFSDFFRSLFGGGASVGPRPAPPRRVEASLDLDLVTAHRGGDVRITVAGRPVTVTVPAGVRDGSKLRLRGQAPGGADLILAVRLQATDGMTLEGDDVRTVVRVPDHVAALGGQVTASSLAGKIVVDVPPGSSTGRVLRLRGQGWLRDGGRRGDQLVDIRVTVPSAPTDAQKAVYQQLRDLSRDAEHTRRSEDGGGDATTGAD